jgi:hypothetical protein
MGNKLGDIKETASDTVEILRQLGTPEVQETLDKVRSLTVTVKEIMETMKSPEWVQNMENIRIIVDNMNGSSERMERTVREMKETGIFEDAKSLMQSARRTMDMFSKEGGGAAGQDMHEVLVAVREMIKSIRMLTDELKAAASESRQSGAVRDLQEAAKDLSSAYGSVKRGAKAP